MSEPFNYEKLILVVVVVELSFKKSCLVNVIYFSTVFFYVI